MINLKYIVFKIIKFENNYNFYKKVMNFIDKNARIINSITLIRLVTNSIFSSKHFLFNN